MVRSRSPSPIRRRRSKSRERDRRRRRSREREPRERRRRSDERKREDRRRRSFSRSRSHSNDRDKSKPHASQRPPVTDAELKGKSPNEQEMMKAMGFCSFDTTKGKKVKHNDIGTVHVILKRKYRQYMNRKGGFNRPLDFVA